MIWLTLTLFPYLLLFAHSFCSFILVCSLNMPGILPYPAPTSFAFPSVWCIFLPRCPHSAFASFRPLFKASLSKAFCTLYKMSTSSHTSTMLYAPSLALTTVQRLHVLPNYLVCWLSPPSWMKVNDSRDFLLSHSLLYAQCLVPSGCSVNLLK